METIRRVTCPLDCPDACGVLVIGDASAGGSGRDEAGSTGSQHEPLGRFVALRGDPDHTWSRGHLCGKTMLYGELVTHPRRLRKPLMRSGPKGSGAPLVETTWEHAFERIVERVGSLPGPEVLALSYGGTMGLVQRKYPYRVMHALGATFHDGGICDAAATAGYECVLGRCLGPDLERVEESDLVVLWGTDVARTVQHLQPRLKRLQERGVPVVAVDVWRTDTLRDVERRGGLAVVVRPGTDAQLALCLARVVFELGFADHAFLERECLGADAFETHVRSRFDLESTAEITGVPVMTIVALSELLRRSRAPIVKTEIGWTRRRNGAMGMRAVCSLAAVLGHGDRVHFESFAHFGLAEDAVVRPDLRKSGAPDVPVTQVALGRELDEGRFRAAFVWCHDPAVTIPDSARFRRGFARDNLFTVVHDHFLTETAELADVVLPATMFVEHEDVYRTYGHRSMQYARPATLAPEGPRSNVEVFSELARRLGLPREVWDVTATSLCRTLLDASRDRIDDGEMERLLRGESVRLHDRLYDGWGTPSGRIELVSASAARAGQPAMADYVPDDAAGDRGAFWLVAAPSVHTHNSTFSHSERHRKKNGPPCVHVNPDDARERGFEAGTRVKLVNARGGLTLPVVLAPEMPRGLVRVDGLPRAVDVPEGVGVNVLASGAVSDLGNGNVVYSARVDLVRA